MLKWVPFLTGTSLPDQRWTLLRCSCLNQSRSVCVLNRVEDENGLPRKARNRRPIEHARGNYKYYVMPAHGYLFDR